MTRMARKNNNNERFGRRGIVVVGVLLIVSLVIAAVIVSDRTAGRIGTRPSSLRREEYPTTRGSSAAATVLRVVLLSDTHGHHRDVTDLPEEGDLLVFAGDFTYYGSRRDAVDFNDWLATLPYTHKVVVAGNHDGQIHLGKGNPTPPEERVSLAELPSLLTNAHYLQDSGFDFRAGGGGDPTAPLVRVWGSPWQPQYATFETHRPPGRGDGGIGRRWDRVPDDTTVLVAHTPPRGILDGRGGRGCADLAARIAELKAGAAGALRLVAFGHMHDGHGRLVEEPEDGGVTYTNAAIVDERRRVTHKAMTVSIALGGE